MLHCSRRFHSDNRADPLKRDACYCNLGKYAGGANAPIGFQSLKRDACYCNESLLIALFKPVGFNRSSATPVTATNTDAIRIFVGVLCFNRSSATPVTATSSGPRMRLLRPGFNRSSATPVTATKGHPLSGQDAGTFQSLKRDACYCNFLESTGTAQTIGSFNRSSATPVTATESWGYSPGHGNTFQSLKRDACYCNA